MVLFHLFTSLPGKARLRLSMRIQMNGDSFWRDPTWTAA
jgi:hypothetical protein